MMNELVAISRSLAVCVVTNYYNFFFFLKRGTWAHSFQVQMTFMQTRSWFVWENPLSLCCALHLPTLSFPSPTTGQQCEREWGRLWVGLKRKSGITCRVVICPAVLNPPWQPHSETLYGSELVDEHLESESQPTTKVLSKGSSWITWCFFGATGVSGLIWNVGWGDADL